MVMEVVFYHSLSVIHVLSLLSPVTTMLGTLLIVRDNLFTICMLCEIHQRDTIMCCCSHNQNTSPHQWGR